MTRGVMAMCVVVVGAVLAAGPVVSGQAKPGANPVLVLETAKGTVEIELFAKDAPKSVEYIVALVKKGFYRGQRFHRAEKSLVQFGDPNSRNVERRNIWGQTSATPPVGIFEQTKRVGHVRGAVGMAHAGRPERAGGQIYIMRAASPSLDGKYTIFGRVTSGLPVIDRIEFQDVIKNATLK